MRWILRSKIHKATVTEANLQYVGSITIDGDLVRRVGLIEGERVLIVSNTSGARLETYMITGAPGTGSICMNGAAAHLIKAGEEIIIMGFELTDEGFAQKVVFGPCRETEQRNFQQLSDFLGKATDEPLNSKLILVDQQNRFVRYLKEAPGKKISDDRVM